MFSARLAGAILIRPRWTPHADPRLEALARGYELLLGMFGQRATVTRSTIKEARR